MYCRLSVETHLPSEARWSSLIDGGDQEYTVYDKLCVSSHPLFREGWRAAPGWVWLGVKPEQRTLYCRWRNGRRCPQRPPFRKRSPQREENLSIPRLRAVGYSVARCYTNFLPASGRCRPGGGGVWRGPAQPGEVGIASGRCRAREAEGFIGEGGSAQSAEVGSGKAKSRGSSSVVYRPRPF